MFGRNFTKKPGESLEAVNLLITISQPKKCCQLMVAAFAMRWTTVRVDQKTQSTGGARRVYLVDSSPKVSG